MFYALIGTIIYSSLKYLHRNHYTHCHPIIRAQALRTGTLELTIPSETQRGPHIYPVNLINIIATPLIPKYYSAS